MKEKLLLRADLGQLAFRTSRETGFGASGIFLYRNVPFVQVNILHEPLQGLRSHPRSAARSSLLAVCSSVDLISRLYNMFVYEYIAPSTFTKYLGELHDI